MTEDQKAHLPDLVSLAMVGFALLKSDGSASEWTHPAIAAFRSDVEPILNARRAAAMEAAQRKWGREQNKPETRISEQASELRRLLDENDSQVIEK